jgi:serine/threonine protein kinase
MSTEATPPSRNVPLAQGSRLQEFEIVSMVGEGGFGIVYLANDLLLHRTVAVKEYMPGHLASRGDGMSVVVHSEREQATFQSGMRSFLAEARMLAQFKHPALVEVLRFWEQNGTAYMVMPYYRGRTLRYVLRDDGLKVDERWLKTLFAPLMDALEMMHAQHVYHRDFSPDNIMVLETGAPVLLDLGAARHITGSDSQAVTAVLKPGFAPIEQYADDSAGQGPWTDIYAIGAVLHFCITGKPPAASVSRILKDSLEPLDATLHFGFGETLLAGIHHAMALKQEDRPQTIAELRSALGMAASVPVGHAPTTTAGQGRPIEFAKPTVDTADAQGISTAISRTPESSTSARTAAQGFQASENGDAAATRGIPAPDPLASQAPPKPKSRAFLYLGGILGVVIVAGVVAWAMRPDERVSALAPTVPQENRPVAITPTVSSETRPATAVPMAPPETRPVAIAPPTTRNTPLEKPTVVSPPGKPASAHAPERAPEKPVAYAAPTEPEPVQARPKSRTSRCVALLDKVSLGIDALTEDELDYVKSKCK